MRYRAMYRRGPNPSEYAFEQLLRENKIDFTRRGYPDYTILQNGRIRGFVEVKPVFNKRLRKGQIAFAKFCEERYIPFTTWTPDAPFPEWLEL
jgi:hypothetical protein